MSRLIFAKRPLRLLRPIGYLFPAAAAGGILWLSRVADARLVEQVYSRRIFVAVASVVGIPARLVPFSLAGLLLAGACLFVAAMAVRLVVLLLGRPGRLHILARHLGGLVLLASCIVLFFAVACAPNYHRMTFSEQSGLVLRNSSVDELAALCHELIADAKKIRGEAPAGGDVVNLSSPFYDLARRSQEAFNTLREDYPFIGRARVAPKPMPASELLSVFNLTGFYFPYTAEANVNAHMPAVEIPFTMCHELAHTVGFMREDEANFLGFLACRGADGPDLVYSGLICALNHSMNALHSADRERYFALRATYSEELEADISAQSAYWQRYYNTPAAKVSNTVNDVYLKANSQWDGTRSYGRMVDLLLADYRARHGLS
jgi:hypothetical protein